MKSLLFIFLLSIPFISLSQEKQNYTEKFSNLYIKKEPLTEVPDPHHSLLAFYSKYISSQDHTECSFYPSCSVYMWESIKMKGFFIGLLKGLDRLSRCNRFQAYLYELNPEQKMIDLP